MGAGLSAEEREAASQAKLTEKEIKVVVKAFKKNKKQSLTATQFSLLMYDIKNKLPGENFKHFSWADHDNLFRMFDTNHDGTVDLKEILIGLSVVGSGTMEEKSEQWFKAINKDDSGFLTRDQVNSALEELAQQIGERLGALSVRGLYDSTSLELQEENQAKFTATYKNVFSEKGLDTIFRADADGDGKLSLREWKNAVKGSNLAKAIVDPAILVKVVDVDDKPEDCILPYVVPAK